MATETILLASDHSSQERNIAPEDKQELDAGPPEVMDIITLDYPTGLKLAIILSGLCLSVFCVALDNTIIATAIPRITDDFHALQDVGWYGSAYLLTTCVFQLFYGKLYSRFSIKGVFLTALFIFEAGSLICATAPNSTALIVGVFSPKPGTEDAY